MSARAAPRLKPLLLPEVERWKTSTGLEVQAMTRGPMPLVTMRFVTQVGSAFIPPGKHGLADFTSGLVRRGTRSLDADALNEAVEFVGGSLSSGATEDFLTITISAPSNELAAMLEILGELATAPAFPEAEIASGRDRVLAQVVNDLDDPPTLADRALLEAVWGDHAYGHDVTGRPSHIRTFDRADAVDFHRGWFGPGVSKLIVVGDVSPEAVGKGVEKAFRKFRGGPTTVPPIPPLAKLAHEGEVVIVDKPDQTQTQIRIGALGMAKNHPDHYAVIAFNTMLGGGFTSRLINEVRVKRGLSYSARSAFEKFRAGGSFEASTFTRTEKTREAVDVVLKEIAKMRQGGPTAQELQTAQRYVAGIYPMRVETNEAIVSSLTEMAVFGLPDDYPQMYRERVAAVTLEEAAAAARRHLFSDSRVIVLVGNASRLRRQLKGLGRVSVRKIAEME